MTSTDINDESVLVWSGYLKIHFGYKTIMESSVHAQHEKLKTTQDDNITNK